jgi:hypothetical protein
MNAQLLDSVTSPIDTRAVAATDDGLRAAEEERAVSISATGGRGDGEHAAAADPPPGADRRRHARPCRRAEEHSRKKNPGLPSSDAQFLAYQSAGTKRAEVLATAGQGAILAG